MLRRLTPGLGKLLTLLLLMCVACAGLIFAGLGAMLFIPGFHETRIAYFAWIGYKGFSFSNIPAV